MSIRGDSDAWHRLQIALGGIPLAGYLCVHLLTQLSAFGGPNAHARWGALPVTPVWIALEVTLLYVPLLVHVALGAWRMLRMGAARPERVPSPLGRQLVAASGAVLLVFLLLHVAEFRLRRWTGELAPGDYYPELCARLSATRWGGVPLAALGHLLGVAAAAHYAAHGLYQAVVGLGWIAAPREPRLRRCCIALGLAWFGVGALIVIDLATGSVLIQLSGS